MSTKHGSYKRHKFHGDPLRFAVLAEYVFKKYGKSIKYIADVAGGRGMLSRILNKDYNYKSEVVDPRGYPLVGVTARQEEFNSSLADYYDLIIGLHPDEATIEVAKSALIRPTILIPCCNFWDRSKTLGRNALVQEISKFYDNNKVRYEIVEFKFNTSKNIGLVSSPKS